MSDRQGELWRCIWERNFGGVASRGGRQPLFLAFIRGFDSPYLVESLGHDLNHALEVHHLHLHTSPRRGHIRRRISHYICALTGHTHTAMALPQTVRLTPLIPLLSYHSLTPLLLSYHSGSSTGCCFYRCPPRPPPASSAAHLVCDECGLELGDERLGLHQAPLRVGRVVAPRDARVTQPHTGMASYVETEVWQGVSQCCIVRGERGCWLVGVDMPGQVQWDTSPATGELCMRA